MRYQASFSEADFEGMKKIAGGLAQYGPFDTNAPLWPVVERGVTNNAADVAMFLTDLA